MRLVSFDAIRTFDVPGVHPLKAEHWFRERERVRAADWVLYPEYWQVNPLVYAWKKRIFPSMSSYHLGHDKIEMTRAFEAVCPANTPFTRILPATASGVEQILDEFSFPCVAKEVRSSMGEGVFLIESPADLRGYAATHDILYVQELLPIRRDLRIVVIGREAVSGYWREAAPGRFHNNVARGAAVSFDDIPESAVGLVSSFACELGIDHAGFDIAVLDGHCFLLEFNVRFGTQALNARGIRLGEHILEYLHAQATPPLEPATPNLYGAG